MSTLHYFQRYSQKENWLTNSTLLLLRHFYIYDYKKFEKFINELDPQIEIQVGPVFNQQIRGKSSVPDGSIIQKPFNILIEAKKGGGLDERQLLGHVDEFQSDSDNILVALTKNSKSESKENKLKTKIANHTDDNVNVTTVFITYEELYKSIRKLLQEYDKEMIELLEDYASMCKREKVFNPGNHTMMAVSCGDSYKENINYSIYYDPIERNHKIPFAYMGIYLNKAIRQIGKVEKVVACNLVEDKLKCSDEDYRKDFDSLTNEEIDRIKGIIRDTAVYNIKKGKKFFILSDLTKTNYKKEKDSAAILSKRYFNLKNIDGFEEEMSAKKTAELLDGQEW